LPTNPHQDAILFVHSQFLGVNEFVLYILQIIIIQIESAFQGSVGDPFLPLKEVENLGENVIEGHSRPSTALASAVLYP
jgi:hypothetical protein